MSMSPMSQSKCDLVAPLLGALADGEATPAEAAFAETHLSACQSCASELAFLRVTNRVLSLTPDVFPSAALSARIAQATYARPTALGRLQAFLRPAPVRAALGSLALAGLVAVAFVAQNNTGNQNGGGQIAGNNEVALPAEPSVATNNEGGPGAKPPVVKPTPPSAPTVKPNAANVATNAPSPGARSGVPASPSAPQVSAARPSSNRNDIVAANGASVSPRTGDNSASLAARPSNVTTPRRSNDSRVASATNAARPRPRVAATETGRVASVVQPAPRRATPVLAGGPAVASPVQPAATVATRATTARRKPLPGSLPGKVEQPPTVAITFTSRPKPVEPEPVAPTITATVPEPITVAATTPAPEPVAASAGRRVALQLPSLRNRPESGATVILTSNRSRRGGDVASAGGRGESYEFGAAPPGRAPIVRSEGSF